MTSYAERVVSCPECAGTRTTKAPKGIRVTCPHCGHAWKLPQVPPATADGGAESPATAGTAPAPAPAAPPSSGAARPGPTRVVIDTGPDDLEPMPRAPLEPVPTHPQTETGRRHGRKGGLGAAARYRQGVARV